MRFLVAVLVLLACAEFAPAVFAAAPPTNCAPVTGAVDAEEQAFLVLLNAYRGEHGLPPLALSATLSRAAAWHVEDMAAKGYFSHTDSLGRGPSQRAQDCGYPQGAGENAAAGFSTALAVFEGWRNSPGHNANMLGVNYRAVGIGRFCLPGSPYGCYWVTDLGGLIDGPPGASPTATATRTPTVRPTATPTRTPAPAPAPVFRLWLPEVTRD